jgi:hypothetical protein
VERVTESVSHSYDGLVKAIAAGNSMRVSLQFDEAEQQLRVAWDSTYLSVKDTPQEAADAARSLIRDQPSVTALALAVARCDAVRLFPRFRQMLEFIAQMTNATPGYKAVAGVPHVQAGFLYMAASVIALHRESWLLLEKLLTTKFQWYFQSGRPLFSYGFDHPYFFHSEAMGRSAPRTHDLFRNELGSPEVTKATGLAGNEAIDAYLQAQMVMCLKTVQLRQAGEDVRIWPDFGRFYGGRVVPLFDRAHTDKDFAAGLCKGFAETPELFFERLNSRLGFIPAHFWSGAPYSYESITSWEPR